MTRLLLPWLAIALMVAVLAACDPDSSDLPPTATVEPTSTPDSANQGELITAASEPVAFAFAPDGRLFYTERTSGEIHTVQLVAQQATAEQLQHPAVLAAKEDLARRADTTADSVSVVSVTPKEWPDECLGLGDIADPCAQVVTPGFEVVLRAPGSDNTYTYRTDDTTRIGIEGVSPVAAESHVFATLDIHYGDECGLIGIDIDPEFEQNHHVYVYAVQPVEGRGDIGKPAIVRYTDVNGEGVDPVVLLEFPETDTDTCAHVSGNLHFGPDGFLYVSVGNFERPELSEGLAAPVGKILRLNKTDGSAAPGNPFESQAGAEPRTFAYGFRNPFDFAFDPQSGKIYAPDNGPGTCDELNVIEPGNDYGAPASLREADVESCLGLGGVDPIYLFAQEGKDPGEFGTNVAPAGVAFLRGTKYPRFGEGLLVCQFVTKELHILTLGGADQNDVTEDTTLNGDCSFNVEIGPDGLIYYSNREGIFRIAAQAA